MRSLSRLLLVVWLLSALPLAVARAGSVSIYPQFDGSSSIGLYVDNSLGYDIGGVNILVTGAATGFTFDPIPNLSIAGDSGYFSQAVPPYDALIANGVFVLQPPTLFATIAPTGAVTRLGTFTGLGTINLFPGETLDPETGEPAFLATFFDNDGRPFAGAITPFISCVGAEVCLPQYGFTLTVPEPLALPLVAALALAAHALGGKIRRRSGSVGAPT